MLMDRKDHRLPEPRKWLKTQHYLCCTKIPFSFPANITMVWSGMWVLASCMLSPTFLLMIL